MSVVDRLLTEPHRKRAREGHHSFRGAVRTLGVFQIII